MDQTKLINITDEQGNTLPTLSAPVPDQYLMLSDSQKQDAILNSDYCIISHPNQTDYFIRTYLIQKLSDNSEVLEYGVWISISKENLNKYLEGNVNDQIFPEYLCTQVFPYTDVYQIRMNIIISDSDQIPESVPQDGQMSKPFVKDYYDGITKKEALHRIKKVYNI